MDLSTKVFNKFKDGTLPWLELDIDFKPFIDSQELNSVDSYYVPHRSDEYGNKGWSSCCLHGLGIELTEVAGQYGFSDELNAPYDWTALTNNAPMATKFWKQFPAEKYSRVRFMKLEAGKVIGKHTDKIDKDLGIEDGKITRLHMPVRTNDLVTFSIWDDNKFRQDYKLKTGHFYYTDVRKAHAVENLSDTDRIHLVMDCYVNNEMRYMIC